MFQIGDIVYLISNPSIYLMVVDMMDREIVVAWRDSRGKVCEAVASWLYFRLVVKARA